MNKFIDPLCRATEASVIPPVLDQSMTPSSRFLNLIQSIKAVDKAMDIHRNLLGLSRPPLNRNVHSFVNFPYRWPPKSIMIAKRCK